MVSTTLSRQCVQQYVLQIAPRVQLISVHILPRRIGAPPSAVVAAVSLHGMLGRWSAVGIEHCCRPGERAASGDVPKSSQDPCRRRGARMTGRCGAVWYAQYVPAVGAHPDRAAALAALRSILVF